MRYSFSFPPYYHKSRIRPRLIAGLRNHEVNPGQTRCSQAGDLKRDNILPSSQRGIRKYHDYILLQQAHMAFMDGNREKSYMLQRRYIVCCPSCYRLYDLETTSRMCTCNCTHIQNLNK